MTKKKISSRSVYVVLYDDTEYCEEGPIVAIFSKNEDAQDFETKWNDGRTYSVSVEKWGVF